MADKEKIREEFSSRLKEAEEMFNHVPSSAIGGLIQAYKNVIDFIDSIEEPVSEDLEKSAGEYANLRKTNYEVAKFAYMTGAQWQKQQMMKDAIDGKICWYDDEVFLDTDDSMFLYLYTHKGFNVGDKVKVIIIKEN